jgi:hypothetical protein
MRQLPFFNRFFERRFYDTRIADRFRKVNPTPNSLRKKTSFWNNRAEKEIFMLYLAWAISSGVTVAFSHVH